MICENRYRCIYIYIIYIYVLYICVHIHIHMHIYIIYILIYIYYIIYIYIYINIYIILYIYILYTVYLYIYIGIYIYIYVDWLTGLTFTERFNKLIDITKNSTNCYWVPDTGKSLIICLEWKGLQLIVTFILIWRSWPNRHRIWNVFSTLKADVNQTKKNVKNIRRQKYINWQSILAEQRTTKSICVYRSFQNAWILIITTFRESYIELKPSYSKH